MLVNKWSHIHLSVLSAGGCGSEQSRHLLQMESRWLMDF